MIPSEKKNELTYPSPASPDETLTTTVSTSIWKMSKKVNQVKKNVLIFKNYEIINNDDRKA